MIVNLGPEPIKTNKQIFHICVFICIHFQLVMAETKTQRMNYYFNPLYTGGLFHCYMLNKTICLVLGLFCRFYSIFDGLCGV